MTVSGRREAWQALYDAYAARLWRNVAQRIASSADVADVVQETLFAAARNFAQFEASQGTAWNWLWGIGHRQVALHYRKRGRLPVDDADAVRLSAWLEAADETAHVQLVRREWGELIRQALSSLTAEYDSLLTARYLEERSVEELAQEAGQTCVALRSKLARARSALREELLRRTPCLKSHDT